MPLLITELCDEYNNTLEALHTSMPPERLPVTGGLWRFAMPSRGGANRG